MMHQLDIITDTPRARVSDPETSHLAAARVKSTGVLGKQQQRVKALVEQYPGCTSAELAMHLAIDEGKGPGAWAVYRPMVARRLPEIAPLYVRKGEARECSVTGSPGIQWWPR